jgi:dipeptidyl aminopeptidase/acylaminoacyl peptidase
MILGSTALRQGPPDDPRTPRRDVRARRLLGTAVILLLLPLENAAAQSRAVTLEAMVSDVRVASPAVSPDGQTILIVSDRSGRAKVWAMDRAGGDARLLVDDEGAESGPAWSADGRSIAFVRFVDGASDIWIVAPDGTGLRRVTSDPDDERGLAWSPDGRRIAFLSARSGHQDVYVVDVSSGEPTRLTEGAMPWDEPRFGVAWSPDGTRLAYVSNESDEWADDVWWVDVNTRAREKLTSGLHVMTSPVWSPDGQSIAFNAVRTEEFWYGDLSDIYLLDAASGTTRKVSMNTHVSDGNGGVRLAWHPDGQTIYFRYLWQGDANLWAVDTAGGVATQMTYERGSFRNFSVAGDGSSVVYVRSTPTRGGELHRLDLEGGVPVRLTDWTTQRSDLEAPERLAFRSTDGKYVLGYLFRPPAFDPSSSYPALVQVHGGGNNAYGNGFHPLEHLLANEGFVVLAIEYRGSAGHGREFQDLALGDWAAGQGWDAVAAARWLEGQPWSNGKVGIYGGSYGGIMTLAALTRDSQPFDAAAPFRGIYDWEDAFEHGDRLMRFWIIEGHFGFRPGERPELFEHTASIRHLDEIRTDLPFLIAHGERDRRAPYQQSVRLVEALRARGNPVEFRSYPNDGHGLSRESRRDAWGRILEFFHETLDQADPMTSP